MIVNPYAGALETYEGTRLLRDTYGIIGRNFTWPIGECLWTIHNVYAPIPRRALGGIRARVVDKTQRVSFVNQRDLEVLLGMGAPGTPCPWSGGFYVSPNHKDWCGLCVDSDDADDDLLERELFIRACNNGDIPDSTRIERVLFTAPDTNIRQLYMSRLGRDESRSLADIDKRWLKIR